MTSKVLYKLLLVLMFLSAPSSGFAATVKINYDELVNPMLVSTFLAEKTLERRNLNTLREIRKAYQGASLAVAGIYEAKRMERRWKSDMLGLVYSSMEVYYYQEIYALVKERIIPKIYSVAMLCMNHPDQAHIWIPMLFRVCSDTHALCVEFANVVCNGNLSFNGISFPQIADELLDIFGITALNGVDWQSVIDGIVDFKIDLPDITFDDVKEDFDNILDFATEFGEGVVNDVEDLWDDKDKVGEGWTAAGADDGSGKKKNLIRYLKKKFKQIKVAVDSLKTIYVEHHENFSPKTKLLEFMEVIDSTHVMDKLFTYKGISGEDLHTAVSVPKDAPQYFRQKYCIVKHYKGVGEWKEEFVGEYEPDYHDDMSWYYNNEHPEYFECWHHSQLSSQKIFYVGCPYDESNNDPEYVTMRNDAKALSLSKSGLGGKTDNSTTKYDYQYSIRYHVKENEGVLGFATHRFLLAYHIRLTKRTLVGGDKEEVLYCETYDSHDGSQDIFEQHMATILEGFNTEKYAGSEDPSDDEHSFSLAIVKENPIYYTETDERRMEGCYAVEFTAYCHDGGELGHYDSEWRENTSHYELCERTKELAMEDLDTLEKYTECLDNVRIAIREKEDTVAILQGELNNLNLQLEEVNKQIALHYSRELKEQAEALEKAIEAKQAVLDKKKEELTRLKDCEKEAIEDANALDIGVRIPWHMRYYSEFYPSLQWEDDGHWEGYTFVRKATITDFGGDLTFRATLSERRKESYFLGIRYHRSIIQIHSELCFDNDTEETVGYMEFPRSTSNAEKVQRVNERRRELQESFENCSISVHENYNEPKTNDEGDVTHLIWASERIRVARRIFSKLNGIFTELQAAEYYLYNCQSVDVMLRMMLYDNNHMTSTRASAYLNQILVDWRMRARAAVAGRRND